MNHNAAGGGKCGGWVWVRGGSNLCYLKDAGTEDFPIRGGYTLTNGRRAGATADDLSVNSGADAGIVAGRAHY